MEKMDYELTEYNSENYLEYLNNLKYPWYEKLWDTIKELFNLRKHFFHLKLFYQRHTRGWDDSDTWNMDESLLHWLLPRLKRFNKLNNGYPDCYETFENWKNEIDRRIIQIERLLNIDEFSFPYHEYLTKEDLKNIKKYHGKGIVEQRVYNSYAYNSCRNDFMEWLKDNLIHLWW